MAFRNSDELRDNPCHMTGTAIKMGSGSECFTSGTFVRRYRTVFQRARICQLPIELRKVRLEAAKLNACTLVAAVLPKHDLGRAPDVPGLCPTSGTFRLPRHQQKGRRGIQDSHSCLRTKCGPLHAQTRSTGRRKRRHGLGTIRSLPSPRVFSAARPVTGSTAS